ncbi:MAG: protein kinase, partial [Gammaproteobacteria bacterium]|nr:protein kinase [Gammaproteobacteria bacterium]
MANKIGRFELVRKLGEGAQGTVYLASDPHLDRQVAIKTLLQDAKNVDVLLKEARIVSKLQHKNIVTL